MPKIIKQKQVVEDRWLIADKDFAGEVESGTFVPLGFWLANRDSLLPLAKQGEIGVWIDSDEEPESLADDAAWLERIAINFPKFADGRGYSYARVLRDHMGYQGELRAIGDVLMDQLFYMMRCGFDSFAVREDRDPQEALEALNSFKEVYQTSVDQPVPLFRRRQGQLD